MGTCFFGHKYRVISRTKRFKINNSGMQNYALVRCSRCNQEKIYAEIKIAYNNNKLAKNAKLTHFTNWNIRMDRYGCQFFLKNC